MIPSCCRRTSKNSYLGAETAVALRPFLGHLFYVLRKAGVVPYPDADEFDLAYADSGLFETSGFEVPPGSAVRVTVMRKGWALRSKAKIQPIRKAVVALLQSGEE